VLSSDLSASPWQFPKFSLQGRFSDGATLSEFSGSVLRCLFAIRVTFPPFDVTGNRDSVLLLAGDAFLSRGYISRYPELIILPFLIARYFQSARVPSEKARNAINAFQTFSGEQPKL
jgi:hypothetical protein